MPPPSLPSQAKLESGAGPVFRLATNAPPISRSEEHTSELQSHVNLVCRLLLEKKKKKPTRAERRARTSPACWAITVTVPVPLAVAALVPHARPPAVAAAPPPHGAAVGGGATHD